jgi:hypothetical protein
MTASRTKEPEQKKISIQPNVELLGFFMICVLAAALAKLRELKPASGRLFVLRRGVIALFAIRALQSNDFTHRFILTDSRGQFTPLQF